MAPADAAAKCGRPLFAAATPAGPATYHPHARAKEQHHHRRHHRHHHYHHHCRRHAATHSASRTSLFALASPPLSSSFPRPHLTHRDLLSQRSIAHRQQIQPWRQSLLIALQFSIRHRGRRRLGRRRCRLSHSSTPDSSVKTTTLIAIPPQLTLLVLLRRMCSPKSSLQRSAKRMQVPLSRCRANRPSEFSQLKQRRRLAQHFHGAPAAPVPNSSPELLPRSSDVLQGSPSVWTIGSIVAVIVTVLALASASASALPEASARTAIPDYHWTSQRNAGFLLSAFAPGLADTAASPPQRAPVPPTLPQPLQAVSAEEPSSDSEGTATNANVTSSPNPADPCYLLSVKPFVSPAQTFACYNSFSVSPGVRSRQAGALKGYLQLSPYIDLFANSSVPGLFPSHVDIFTALDAVAADDSIQTEFQLHSALGDVVSSLRDPHIAYRSGCFTQGTFLQPWVIAANYSSSPAPSKRSQLSSSHNITIVLKSTVFEGSAYLRGKRGSDPTRMSHLTTYFLDSTGGRNPHDYVGWIVESINGIDPVKYIQDYADRFVSISKSPDTRFNLALASVQYVEGEWRPFDGYLYRTSNLMAVISSGGKRPSSADSDLKQAGANEAIGSVRYALLDPSTGRRETVTANWAGDFEGFRDGLASREAYYGKCAGRKAVVPPAPGASRSGDGDGVYGSSGSHSDSGVENSLDSEEVDLADFANADFDDDREALQQSSLPLPPRYRRGQRYASLQTPTNANVPKMFANGNNEIISSELYNVMAAPQVDWNYLRDKISQTHGDLITPTHPSSVQPQDLPAAARSKGENLTVGIPAPQRPTKKKDEREPIVSDRNGAFYKLDNATGVWVLSTFIPSAQTPRGVADWLGSMVRGLDALEDVGVRKLLIHVSGNGGGFQCVVPAIVQFLFNSSIPLSFDMRYTPLLETLIASAPPISPLSVTGVGILPANATAPTTPVTPDDPPAAVAYARNVSDVFPTDPDQQRVLTRGGRSSVYSVRFNQVALCNEFVNEFASMMRGRLGGSKGRRAGTSARRDAAPGKDGGDGEGGDSAKAGDGHGDVDGTTAGDISEDKDAPGHIASPKLDQYHRRLWDPRDIVVVSDGFCGSACGHLVRMLRDGHGVRSIVYGGGLASARAATGGAFTPSSFEGANVVMFNDLLSVYRRSQRTATRTGDPASNHRRDASPSPPPQELFPFPLRARGQVALWEAYSDSGSGGTRAPMEWVVHPADAGVGAAATAAAPGSGGAAATAGLGVADPEGVVRVWKRATAMLDAWRPAGGGAAAAAPSSGK